MTPDHDQGSPDETPDDSYDRGADARDDTEPQDAPDGDDGGFDLLAVLEAMMFASTEPLTIEEIMAALPGQDPRRIEAGLDALARALDSPERGLRLEKVAGGYRLVTRPELAESLRALFRFRNQKRLTPAALDVLAIVAYAQPITSPEIQEIRGTDPSYALRTLMDRGLVRMLGRKRVVGRPILYGTTREFLFHFGLDSLEDLPPVEGFGTRVAPSQGRLFPVTTTDFDPLEDVPAPPPEIADGATESEPATPQRRRKSGRGANGNGNGASAGWGDDDQGDLAAAPLEND